MAKNQRRRGTAREESRAAREICGGLPWCDRKSGEVHAENEAWPGRTRLAASSKLLEEIEAGDSGRNPAGESFAAGQNPGAVRALISEDGPEFDPWWWHPDEEELEGAGSEHAFEAHHEEQTGATTRQSTSKAVPERVARRESDRFMLELRSNRYRTPTRASRQSNGIESGVYANVWRRCPPQPFLVQGKKAAATKASPKSRGRTWSWLRRAVPRRKALGFQAGEELAAGQLALGPESQAVVRLVAPRRAAGPQLLRREPRCVV